MPKSTDAQFFILSDTVFASDLSTLSYGFYTISILVILYNTMLIFVMMYYLGDNGKKAIRAQYRCNF
jgi:hypothetical protein